MPYASRSKTQEVARQHKREQALIEEEVDEKHIEQRLLRMLAQTKSRALTAEDCDEKLGVSRKALWAAVRRLDEKGQIFRFDIDGVDYFCLPKHAKTAYVDQPNGFTDERIEELYGAFGIRMPETIRRTPRFIVLDDDELGRAYSRYAPEAA